MLGKLRAGCVLLLIGTLIGRAGADPGRLTVKVDQPGVKISPMLYGLMTEEINHAYDGGLYAELIRNRAFKDDRYSPAHWTLVEEGGGSGEIALDDSQPLNATLTTSLKLTIGKVVGKPRVGVANDGYWGIPVKPETRYRASFYAKVAPGFTGPLTVDIESGDGATVYASATVSRLSTSWRAYTVTLRTGKVTPTIASRFVLSTAHSGTIWFSLVSLFPPAYHNRANGNRIDLMQLLGDMKPAFLRLPGGNYLEGNSIAERFDWKRTLGPPPQRPGHQGPWGYRSTDGLGLLEFLEWCEDLKMEPVLAVFAGYALNREYVAPGPQLTPFVQDALEEIEYITGGTGTHWGARRAADGHPAPFKLRYVEIGNEDWFDRSGSYDGRFAQFHDAIKAKYPNLQLIATTAVRSRKPDVLDDYYYRSALAMERDVHHYDSYDRNGPKIFVGEWASMEGSPTPNLNAALGDAIWLTGLERNSDLVQLSCYAPLLVNVNPGARQWRTNLIGYDALNSFGSPSYYVQKMFGNNRGDVVLPVDIEPQQVALPASAPPQGAIGVGTWSTQAEYKDVEVTQGDKVVYQKDFTGGADGWRLGTGAWRAEDGVLRQTSANLDCRAIAGSADWTDYTYRLKARKIAGQEGFLILFHVRDRDNWVWWNVGGWGNTRTALERSADGNKMEIGRAVPVTVETGRWYDVRIEVQGRNIRCYLDDKLVTEAVDGPPAPPMPLYATASRDNTTGEVIVKVVNVGVIAQQMQVELQGVHEVSGASEQVLAGQPQDMNTIAAPEKVAPKAVSINAAGRTFTNEFPAYSVTVIRFKVR